MNPFPLALIVPVLLGLMLPSHLEAATRPPNIVIILADDLGYGDLGCYGHPSIRTPNLDRMAAEGTRFTDFYVPANVCTPSRAALLTGRLPLRNGMAGTPERRVVYARHTGGLPAEEITSDNGPWLVRELAGGSAGLLKEGKGSSWEGGMRVPGIAWWPGKIKAGVVSRELASSMDLFNTSLKLAGVPLPADRVLDGVDMSPILFGAGKSLRDAVFYYRGSELFAIRKGDFKAHFITANGYASLGNPLKYEPHDPPWLYNVATDPGEKFEIGHEHLEVIAEIRKLLAEHQATLVPGKPQY